MLLKRFANFKFCTISRLPNYNNAQNTKRIFESDDATFKTLTPPKIIQQLDKKVIGQVDAKRVLAIAFRNRLRRLRVPVEVRHTIRPSNILMQGPTGCGKTQLCKALAGLSDAPFLRVQATKYTEVGYVGKDVSTLGSELMRQSLKVTKTKISKKQQQDISKVPDYVNEQIVGSMLGMQYKGTELWQRRLQDVKEGLWDDRQLTILAGTFHPDKNCILTQVDGEMISSQSTIADLKVSLRNYYVQRIKEYVKLIDIEEQSIRNAEENGIVFIDEIDKIAVSQNAVNNSKGVSTEGVQRDFLPLLQGTLIPTTASQKSNKFIRTDNILFIGGGSFARVQVEDMLPELLGRLPVRVNLKDIKQDDLCKILLKQNGLIDQERHKMRTQNVNIEFSEEAIRQIARLAYNDNIYTENLGARRLSTMMTAITTKCNMNAHEYAGTTYLITKEMVLENFKNNEKRNNPRSKLI